MNQKEEQILRESIRQMIHLVKQKRAKEQETGEKRKNIYMAAAAISVLALSGFIIS